MQRKLTEGEIEKLKQARSNINDVLVPAYGDHGQYLAGFLFSLDDNIKHGTSDGKPWVEPEPEPEILPGWRIAFDYEYDRKDIKIWDFSQKIWVDNLSTGGDFVPGNIYIVPVDPPLTDEDACVCPRLLVMVRDYSDMPWLGPFQYFGKGDDLAYPFVINGMGKVGNVWKQARRATREEIESMNRK